MIKQRQFGTKPATDAEDRYLHVRQDREVIEGNGSRGGESDEGIANDNNNHGFSKKRKIKRAAFSQNRMDAYS